VLSVKAEQVATFLGRRITPHLAQEIGSQFSTRIEGTCVKHRFGKASIKMYDKFAIVLRIETTSNDVSFFKHHRKVERRNGPPTRGLAGVKKSIYSLIDLREIMLGCNRRYLTHFSTLNDVSAGVRALGRVPRRATWAARRSRGSTFSNPLTRRCCTRCKIHGSISPACAGVICFRMFSPTRLSRQLRRLRDLGAIKKVAGTYRYYLTKAGRAAVAAAERLTQAVLIPALV
jgi:hypothetical protein